MRTKSLYVALGDVSCRRDVVEFGCDKTFGIDEKGAWFGCFPVMGTVTEDLPGCRGVVSQVTYQVVASCKKRRLKRAEIPMDYAPTSTTCNFYIDPPESQ